MNEFDNVEFAPEYKTTEELYTESLGYANSATTEELLDVLKERTAYHSWFIRACEKALMERN